MQNELTIKLRNAVVDGTIAEIEDLVKQGADPNGTKHDGHTYSPFLTAANYSRAEAVRCLIRLGADLKATNIYLQTALMIAIKNTSARNQVAYEDTIRALLAAGVDVLARDDDDESALEIAVNSGTNRAVELLCETDARHEINRLNKEGITPLMAVVSSDYEKERHEKIKTLLDAGADANTTDKTGCTLLMALSCLKDGADFVDDIISHCTNLNAADPKGQTALSIAMANKNERMFIKLAQAGAHFTQDLILSLTDNKQTSHLLELLYDHKPDVLIQNGDDVTLLMKASQQNNLPLVKRLVAAGADPNRRDKKGRTALLLTGDSTIMRYLINEAKADINVVSRDGRSSLQRAFEIGDFDLGMDLLSRGLSLEAINARPTESNATLFSQGSITALSKATEKYYHYSYRGHEEERFRCIIVALLKAGANPHIKCNYKSPYEHLTNRTTPDKEIMSLLNPETVENQDRNELSPTQ